VLQPVESHYCCVFDVSLLRFSIFWLHKPNKRIKKIKTGESEMKKTLRRQKSGYAVSFLLWFLGLAALLWIFWKTWPSVSGSSNPFSVFWESLWNEAFDLIPGVEFKLVYLMVFASAMFVTGFIVFGRSRQWFMLGGNKSLLQCPWCRKKWRTNPQKALVLCPYCRQLVHPILADE